jgi:hypothetical protein
MRHVFIRWWRRWLMILYWSGGMTAMMDSSCTPYSASQKTTVFPRHTPHFWGSTQTFYVVFVPARQKCGVSQVVRWFDSSIKGIIRWEPDRPRHVLHRTLWFRIPFHTHENQNCIQQRRICIITANDKRRSRRHGNKWSSGGGGGGPNAYQSNAC